MTPAGPAPGPVPDLAHPLPSRAAQHDRGHVAAVAAAGRRAAAAGQRPESETLTWRRLALVALVLGVAALSQSVPAMRDTWFTFKEHTYFLASPEATTPGAWDGMASLYFGAVVADGLSLLGPVYVLVRGLVDSLGGNAEVLGSLTVLRLVCAAAAVLRLISDCLVVGVISGMEHLFRTSWTTNQVGWFEAVSGLVLSLMACVCTALLSLECLYGQDGGLSSSVHSRMLLASAPAPAPITRPRRPLAADRPRRGLAIRQVVSPGRAFSSGLTRNAVATPGSATSSAAALAAASSASAVLTTAGAAADEAVVIAMASEDEERGRASAEGSPTFSHFAAHDSGGVSPVSEAAAHAVHRAFAAHHNASAASSASEAAARAVQRAFAAQRKQKQPRRTSSSSSHGMPTLSGVVPGVDVNVDVGGGVGLGNGLSGRGVGSGRGGDFGGVEEGLSGGVSGFGAGGDGDGASPGTGRQSRRQSQSQAPAAVPEDEV